MCHADGPHPEQDGCPGGQARIAGRLQQSHGPLLGAEQVGHFTKRQVKWGDDKHHRVRRSRTLALQLLIHRDQRWQERHFVQRGRRLREDFAENARQFRIAPAAFRLVLQNTQ